MRRREQRVVLLLSTAKRCRVAMWVLEHVTTQERVLVV
jgi:hypothetical protein